jgi:outer membrane protein TolC
MSMKLRPTVITTLALVVVGTALAQEPRPVAPSPQDVRLLDEVPNYAEILKHQWSAGVPQDVIDDERSVEQYGRLAETGPAQATTLAECIALAVENNTGLQIQRLGPVGAAAGVRRAWSVFDPRLFADITRNRLVTPATTFLTAGSVAATSLFNQNFNWDAGVRKTLVSGGQLSLAWTNNRLVTNASIAYPVLPLYTTTVGLTLTQPLLRDFGWRYALLIVEIAQNTEQTAYYQYEASIATLVAQVERAYWALVLAIESVRVQEQSLALAQELLRQNQGKFNVGALAHAAVLEAQSQVASREATLIRARNLLDNARDRLRALINYREPGAAALLTIDPQDKPAVTPYDIDQERSLNSALEERPELIAARLEIHGKGLQRKIAENQLLPKLNFVGAAGVNGLAGSNANATFNGEPIPVNPSVIGNYGSALGLLPDGRYYNYAAGATVEIPLSNAQAKADYAKANIDLDQSSKSLQKLQEDVTLEIKTAVTNLQTDLKSIDATRIARELAEENLRNQQARYDVGLATTKDILDFQDQLTRARFLEVEALTQYNGDLAEMRRVDGTLLKARNVLIERVSPEKAPWWASF